MTTDEITTHKKFEERLRQERKALIARIEEQLHASEDPGQCALANRLAETGDWTLADLQGEIDVALLSQETAGLREIDAALKRISGGVYGICGDCGKPIGSRRLDAQPAARLCVDCKAAFERRHGIASPPTI